MSLINKQHHSTTFNEHKLKIIPNNITIAQPQDKIKNSIKSHNQSKKQLKATHVANNTKQKLNSIKQQKHTPLNQHKIKIQRIKQRIR